MNISDSSVSDTEITNSKRMKDIDEVLNAESDFWEKFCKYFLSNNLELKCLEQTASLINSVPGNKFQIPTTKYLILKKFSMDKLPVFFWIYCDTCAKYQSSETGSNKFCCCLCNAELFTEKNKYFVAISLLPQLKKILIDNWDAVINYQMCERDTKFIHDNLCGSISSNLQQNNPLNLKLTLLLNTDGVQVFKSTTKSLWPIQIICNFLPPNIRFNQKNIIVSGLCYVENKPDMLSFFEPIACELNDMDENGISIHINGENVKINVHITQCSLDLPAQSLVQNIILYNGYKACPGCLHNGVSVQNESNKRRFVRYIWRGVTEEPRTHSGALADLDAVARGKVIKH